MKTITDKSTRNLAEMLAEGSHQGIMDCRKCQTDFPQATIGAKKLLQQLETFQEESCQKLEGFL